MPDILYVWALKLFQIATMVSLRPEDYLIDIGLSIDFNISKDGDANVPQLDVSVKLVCVQA